MKIEKIGWTYKSKDIEIKIDEKWSGIKQYEFPDFFVIKGKRDSWDTDDWPPKKVKITLEWEE